MCPVHRRESFHGPSVHVRELAVAITLDVSFTFNELVLALEQQFKQHTKLMFGFSSNFYAQIQNGAVRSLLLSRHRYLNKQEEVG